jgi:hypothetical protein
MKIWEWIKTMVFTIAGLIPRWFKRQATAEPEPAPHVVTPLERKLAREIQKRQAKEIGRAIDTREGGPNMPRYQPCPKDRGLKKRVDKAIVGGVPGALYYCNRCKTEFFVKAKGV